MSDMASKFKSPVISGNVSFYNEMEGVKINPTPAVGVIGVEKLDNIRTMNFKNENDKIIIIGKTYDEIEKKNEYNLNITRYIDSTDPEDIQDISRRLRRSDQEEIRAIADISPLEAVAAWCVLAMLAWSLLPFLGAWRARVRARRAA